MSEPKPLSATGAVRCGSPSQRSGEQCGANALRGTVPPRCRHHAGNTKARAKAAVRAEVSDWGLNDEHVDPGEQLLKLLAQSARRAARYSLQLELAFEAARAEAQVRRDEATAAALGGDDRTDWEDRLRVPHGVPDGVGALVGVTVGSSEARGLYAKGEELRGLVRVEADERDRCARFAKLALDAGINERLVRIQEDQIAQVIAMVRRLVVGLGLSPTDPRVSEVVIRELRILDEGS